MMKRHDAHGAIGIMMTMFRLREDFKDTIPKE